MLAILSVATFNSCKDDENAAYNMANRQFMTMFRQQSNTGLSDANDEYRCRAEGNTIYLYWFAVNDCYGYEIKWFYSSTVQSGTKEVWEQAEADGYMKGDTVITNPMQVELVLKNMSYSQAYRFAIRVLHSADKNDPENSAWYGYGDQQNPQDYCMITTDGRYACPEVISYIEYFPRTDPKFKTSFKVHISKDTQNKKKWDAAHLTETIEPYSAEDKEIFAEHFTSDANGWKVDYLTIESADETVKLNIPSQFTWDESIKAYKYVPTAEEWAQGWFQVDGLSPNSLYTIKAWDASIPIKVDASYKNMMVRTKGDPVTLYLGHTPTPTDTISGKAYDISKWNAMKLDNILNDYMTNEAYGENSTIYLDGGKAYFISSGIEMIKGFKLETRPEDLAQGKRATLYLSGLVPGTSTNWVTGNDAGKYSDPTVQLVMDTIKFKGIDFACPNAVYYSAIGNGSGNYFINMYSKNIGFSLDALILDDCSFQNLQRGFYRVQGSYDFNINNFIINNCVFTNCGPYDANAIGYNWIHFELGSRPSSNLLNNCQITNNVFYNTPHGALISDKNKSVTWAATVRWNVKISNNTFVNFGNSKKNEAYVAGLTGYIPGGSTMEFTKNLIIMTKDPADVNRPMNCAGWRCGSITGGDGSGQCTFIIGDNYSTNDNLTSGQVFNTYAFSGTSNCPGKWQNSNPEWFPMGIEQLVVKADNISATELMKSPNPKHFVGSAASQEDYKVDGIDGIMYNLSTKTLNSDIYKKGIGAPRLRK